jgi:IMP dehydrogenase
VRFARRPPPTTDLTYEDVFLVPVRSAVASRLDVDLASDDGTGTTIPLVAANMTSVSGRRMAETLARRGGLAVIPQDIPLDIVEDVVRWVKSRHPVFETPITLTATDTVGDALNLLDKRAHGAAVVVDDDGRPIGVVTHVDLDEVDRFTQVGRTMSREVATVPDTVDPREAFDRLAEVRHRLAPVVDDEGRLVGLLTRTGALRSTLYRPALDADGRLRLGAAIGVSGDAAERAERLLEAGVDVLVLDTAHGHQERMLESLEAVRKLGAGGPQRPDRGRQRRHPRGRRRPRRRRRGHRQGRRRSGGDVHHPDGDRGRPAAVLRRAHLRRGRPATSAHTCGRTAGSATPGTSRSRSRRAPPTS